MEQWRAAQQNQQAAGQRGPKKPVGGGFQFYRQEWRASDTYREDTEGFNAVQIGKWAKQLYAALPEERRAAFVAQFEAKWGPGRVGGGA